MPDMGTSMPGMVASMPDRVASMLAAVASMPATVASMPAAVALMPAAVASMPGTVVSVPVPVPGMVASVIEIGVSLPRKMHHRDSCKMLYWVFQVAGAGCLAGVSRRRIAVVSILEMEYGVS